MRRLVCACVVRNPPPPPPPPRHDRFSHDVTNMCSGYNYDQLIRLNSCACILKNDFLNVWLRTNLAGCSPQYVHIMYNRLVCWIIMHYHFSLKGIIPYIRMKVVSKAFFTIMYFCSRMRNINMEICLIYAISKYVFMRFYAK